MTDEARTSTGPHDRPHYRAAREAFERLDAADKAAFLLESAFGAAGEMVAEAARAVSDVVERAASAEFWGAPAAGSATADQAEPDGPRPKRRPSAPGAADAGSPATPPTEPLN